MIIEQVKRALQKHPDLRLAILFGSQASGRATDASDVDVAVLAPRALDAATKMSIISDLADATGRPVDLVDLRTAGEPMLGQVFAHGVRLCGSDQAYAEVLSRHLIDANDFMPYVERLLAARRQAWIGS